MYSRGICNIIIITLIHLKHNEIFAFSFKYALALGRPFNIVDKFKLNEIYAIIYTRIYKFNLWTNWEFAC